jgi:hypothetical protein
MFVWVVVTLAMSSLVGFPEPVTPEEFSNLLAADTFVAGRLTNPAPRCWVHLEAPGVFFEPSYMANARPGPALVFAFGLLIFGTAWPVSLFLSLVISVGWVLTRGDQESWRSLVTRVLAALAFALLPWSAGVSRWVPFLLGAMVLRLGGALMRKRINVHGALLSGVGLALLVLSEPKAGFFWAVVVMAFLTWNWYIRGVWKSLWKIAAVWAAMVVPVVGGLYLMNQGATGNGWRSATAHWQEKYGVREGQSYRHAWLEDLLRKNRFPRTLRQRASRTFWLARFSPRAIASVAVQRPMMISRLRATGRQALVLVEYHGNPDRSQDWVFNSLNPVESDVVWARSITPVLDRALCGCFPDRDTYVLKTDGPIPELKPWPGFCDLRVPLSKLPRP